MGQVFTLESVRRGHVPRLESFAEVVNQLRTRFRDTPSIVGALVCGSVVRGDHTIRSDIDCFVLYDHNVQHDAFGCMHELSRFAVVRHVPLSFVPCDTELSHTRMHHVGTSFLHHLARSAEGGGLLKGNPLEAIVEGLSEKAELESYMRVKMYNLQEAWSMIPVFSEERKVAYLKKLLEAPMHIARKVLAHRGLLTEDSKTYVHEKYREVMSNRLSSQFDQLIRMDKWYTEQLVSQQNKFDELSYVAAIQALIDVSEDVLQFIRANLVFIAETAH